MTRVEAEELLSTYDHNPDAVFFDGMDSAIVGLARQQFKPALVVYDYDLLVKACQEQGMDEEGAREFVDFNIVNLWAGPGTPLILQRS